MQHVYLAIEMTGREVPQKSCSVTVTSAYMLKVEPKCEVREPWSYIHFYFIVMFMCFTVVVKKITVGDF